MKKKLTKEQTKALKQKMSALGKLSHAKRKGTLEYKEQQSKAGKLGGKALWNKITLD